MTAMIGKYTYWIACAVSAFLFVFGVIAFISPLEEIEPWRLLVMYWSFAAVVWLIGRATFYVLEGT